jgi:hypothetical protein
VQPRSHGRCAAGLPPPRAGLPGEVPALLVGAKALPWTLRLCPHLRPPGGAHGRHRRRCALPVPLVPVTPNPPRAGVLRIATAPEGQRLCRSCRCLWRLCRAALGFLSTRVRPASIPLWSFLPPWKALQCTALGLLRQGQALQASVLADSGRRPCTGRGTGGAHACLTRRGRGLADRVEATCPHTPRRSLRSAVGRTVFDCRAVCG